MPAKSMVSLREYREKTIAVLSEHFAQGSLELDEYEERVSLAHRAATVAEVDKLVEDLPALASEPKPTPSVALVPEAGVKEKQSVVAILGGAVRQGSWSSAKQLRVVAVLGGSVLDFREARLRAGTTDVKVTAVMGGVQIIVPPGLAVETGGVAILGGFEHMERVPDVPDPERPVLNVQGFCFMGGVSIETRLPGETEGDARRRRRKERKERRRLTDGRSS